MKQLCTCFLICFFICRLGESQDYLVYPDSSFRVVTIQKEYTTDVIVGFVERNKQFRIKRSQLMLLIESHELYKTVIERDNKTTKGFLYQISDKHIVLIQFTPSNKLKTVTIPIEEVELLVVKRHGGKGAAIGAACGLVVGAVMGFAQGDTQGSYFDSARATGQNVALYGVLLAIDGALIGGLIGSRKVEIQVNGHTEKLDRHRAKLNQLSIVKE